MKPEPLRQRRQTLCTAFGNLPPPPEGADGDLLPVNPRKQSRGLGERDQTLGNPTYPYPISLTEPKRGPLWAPVTRPSCRQTKYLVNRLAMTLLVSPLVVVRHQLRQRQGHWRQRVLCPWVVIEDRLARGH